MRRALWLVGLAAGSLLAPSAAAAAPEPCSAWPDCFYPLLGGEDSGASRSVGDAVHGFLVGGRRLPESDAVSFVPALRPRDLAFGTAELVALIEYAARQLHEATGTKLFIGNLSKEGGGDIAHSVSHNSGRDADLAFCYADKAGRPVAPTSLDPVRGNGHSAHGLRFDVARNWRVVKAVLTYPGPARVQFVFVAGWLKRMLLDHARAEHEPAELLARANEVLQHPVGSAAHDDHFHVRIYCGERDAGSGCIDGGDFRQTASTLAARHHDEIGGRIARARAQLADANPRARIFAIERLMLLRARRESLAIATLLGDSAPEVRWSAACALGWLVEERDAPRLALYAQREADGVVKAELLRSLARAHGAVGARLFSFPATSDSYLVRAALYTARIAEARLVREGAEPVSIERARSILLGATEAAERVERLEPIEPLLDLLTHSCPRVRAAAAHALAVITNHEIAAPWDDPDAEPLVLRAAAARWRNWISAYAPSGRDALVAAGFRAARYRYEPRAPQSLYELVRALSGKSYQRHNAEELLSRLTMHHPPEMAAAERCNDWREWLIGHRSLFQVGMPVTPVECVP